MVTLMNFSDTRSPRLTSLVCYSALLCDQLISIAWYMVPSFCTGLTQKIVYVNTYDPFPRESEVFLFDVVNKSWSNTGRACPMASELSTCVSVEGGGALGSGGGDSLLVIGGWTNLTGTKSLNQRGAVNVIHEFKVHIYSTEGAIVLWYQTLFWKKT